MEFVFVCDKAAKPPLFPLYRGLYRVLRRSKKFFVLQIGDKSDSVSVDRLKPVISSRFSSSSCISSSRLTSPSSSLGSQTSGSLFGASLGSQTSGSWLSSCEESEVLSGSSYAAPQESSPDGLRFSVSLRHPPTSPSGWSILWLLQRRPSSSSILQTQRKLSRNVLS